MRGTGVSAVMGIQPTAQSFSKQDTSLGGNKVNVGRGEDFGTSPPLQL